MELKMTMMVLSMFMVFRPAFCEQQDGIDQTIVQLKGEARDDLIKDVEEYGREIVMRTSEGEDQ